MSRFQKATLDAITAIREMEEEHRIFENEHRELDKLYAEAVAENKRLKFALYGTHSPTPDDRFNSLARRIKDVIKAELYFDVTIWKWVGVAEVPYGEQS